jgi:dihydroorotate dehydrogenase electron transfer subunit
MAPFMPAPPDDARCFDAETTHVEPCGSDGAILSIKLAGELGPVRAGRFFMLRRQDALSPAIPRPFSIYRQHADGTLDFLIKIMGSGTRALADTVAGTKLLAVGPLGGGWSMHAQGAPWVMLAGGIGSAPFYLAIEQALHGADGHAPVASEAMTLIYGAAHAGLLYDFEAFEALGVRTLAATDDGSRGARGNVLELLQAEWRAGRIPEQVRLLACGPDPMLKAVAKLARERQLACWLSLETMMGCGVGICNGCAVETEPHGPLGAWPVAKCCVEGPVFAADAIRF